VKIVRASISRCELPGSLLIWRPRRETGARGHSRLRPASVTRHWSGCSHATATGCRGYCHPRLDDARDVGPLVDAAGASGTEAAKTQTTPGGPVRRGRGVTTARLEIRDFPRPAIARSLSPNGRSHWAQAHLARTAVHQRVW